jgi:hypothetical protein
VSLPRGHDVRFPAYRHRVVDTEASRTSHPRAMRCGKAARACFGRAFATGFGYLFVLTRAPYPRARRARRSTALCSCCVRATGRAGLRAAMGTLLALPRASHLSLAKETSAKVSARHTTVTTGGPPKEAKTQVDSHRNNTSWVWRVYQVRGRRLCGNWLTRACTCPSLAGSRAETWYSLCDTLRVVPLRRERL